MCAHIFLGVLAGLPGGVGVNDRESELLELGEQGAHSLRVVEQWLPGGELVVGEPAGDGLAVYLAGPFGVGAVQLRRGGGGGGAGAAPGGGGARGGARAGG